MGPDSATRKLSRIQRDAGQPDGSRMTSRVVAAAVVLTRLPVLLAGVLAVTLIGTIAPPTGLGLWRVSSHEIANLLARWDTAYYYSIATEGYHWDPATFSHQNVSFVPLYPLLMRWGGALLGGRPPLAGLIVSLVSFAGAVAVLYRLAITTTEVVTWIGNIAAFGVAVAATAPVWRRFGMAYAVWIVVNLVPPVAMHLFVSLGRFTAVLFPVFFWLAMRIPTSRVPAVAMAFAAGQIVLAVWFFLWHPVV